MSVEFEMLTAAVSVAPDISPSAKLVIPRCPSRFRPSYVLGQVDPIFVVNQALSLAGSIVALPWKATEQLLFPSR